MDMKTKINPKIIDRLTKKSVTKYEAYDNTMDAFEKIKKVFEEIATTTKQQLEGLNKDIPVEYKERGTFEVEMKAAGDLLVAVMHTNIFEFPKPHSVQQTKYVKEDPLRAYTGIIYFYNFLADSFKYDRVNDGGYLVARIFINKDNHFFVEGKKQLGFLFNDFVNQTVSTEKLKEVVEEALLFSIDFDIVVPKYEQVAAISVQEMKLVTSSYSLKTGKPLGFQLNSTNSEKK